MHTGDAAVLRVKGTDLGLAMTIDCVGSYCALDPAEGGRHAVAEAARNIACSGAVPIGVTNCLNFGNPEKPDVFYMFEKCVTAMGDACRAFGLPITGGNVSFYNENPQGAIDPTPVIGMMGRFEDVTKQVTQWFKDEGDPVYLLGSIGDSIGASRYLAVVHGKKTGHVPKVDLDAERRLQEVLRSMADSRVLKSAHDCSDGGFAVALAECCFSGRTHEQKERGCRVSLPGRGRLDARLFGEAAGRVILTVSPGRQAEAESLLKAAGLPFERIGTVGGSNLAIEGALDVAVADLAEPFFTSIEKIMS